MRENAAAKGRRLLSEGQGRLTVDRVDVTAYQNGIVLARCKGDSGTEHSSGFDPSRQDWHCNCPAKSDCSHLVALKLIVVRGR